ncbi:MAG: hypothetical protein ACIAQF_05740, partial [Phycisphaerales bacterium JB065]
MSESPKVTVRAMPDAGTWAKLARARFASLTDSQRQERALLGLPTDRPVIMTGHQSGFWHPGILSKYIAGDRLAKAINGVAAAIVVDHDVVDPLRINAVGQTQSGQIESVVVSLRARSGSAMLSRLEAPISRAELGRWTGADRLLQSDREAVEQIIASLLKHTDAESLGEQAARANAELLAPWMRVQQFTAQQLVRSAPWKAFFERALEDPAACVRAYNSAVTKHSEAGIPTLFAIAREHRWELPFWLLDRSTGRRPLYEEMVHHPSFDPDLLATKALSLTASVRRNLCDLFIHGSGGAIYDRATDDWIKGWLGEKLAPSVAITADVYRALPVDAQRDATQTELDHAMWLAHSARHNPELLGDERGEHEKRQFLKHIRDAPTATPQRT